MDQANSATSQTLLFRAGEFMLDEPMPATPIVYGVQPTPTTCPWCGAQLRCCGGAKEA